MSNRYSNSGDRRGFSPTSSSSSPSPPPRRSRRSRSPSSQSRSRSRSRSPQRSRHRIERRQKDEDTREEGHCRPDAMSSERSNDSSRSDKSSRTTTGDVPGTDSRNIPRAPSAPKISRATIMFGKPGTVARPGIHMKLAPAKPKSEPAKKITVASAFNNDSDEEVEEMPPECKMRMRNIGRDTPTSSGPNSFGKTKQGFIDSKKLFEKSLKEAATD